THVLVEYGMAGLIVGGINENALVSLNAESQASLRMVQPHGLDDAIVKCDAVFFNVIEVAMRGHLCHVDREVRIGHLLFDRALQSAAAAGRVEEEVIVRICIKRKKERDALDVVPMEMREEDVRVNRT